MCRLVCSVVLVASFLVTCAALAQGTGLNGNTTCNFDATKQVAVEFMRMPIEGKKKLLGNEIPFGQPWAPGGKPMTMFTNTPIAIGNVNLPIGAYTMFVIPDQKNWTLIISKSTDMSGKYDEKQDIARIPMKTGKLPTAVTEFTAYFAHVAPTQCNLRFDLQKTRGWTVINEK
jgi:hypothetical protein